MTAQVSDRLVHDVLEYARNRARAADTTLKPTRAEIERFVEEAFRLSRAD